MKQKLIDIYEKYHSNLCEIEAYINYMETTCYAMMANNRDLEIVSPTFFKKQTVDNICENTKQIRIEMNKRIEDLQKEKASITWIERNGGPTADDPTPDGDMLMYLYREITKGEHNKDVLFAKASSVAEALSMMKGELVDGERYIELSDNPAELRELIDIALNEDAKNTHNRVEETILSIQRSVKALDMLDPINHLNIYRQSFIQTMAYFDSCIFEMVQACMKENFFEWINAFENRTVKTHDIAQYNSFEEFQIDQIQLALKSCYIKELLTILRNKENRLFEIDGKDVFAKIIEAVNCRNVHIHHNGKADEQYLSAYNLFSRKKDEYILIDKTYFQDICCYTRGIVEIISKTF